MDWYVRKPTVRPHIFRDMQRFVKDLNPDDYEVSDFFQTSDTVIDFLREYYDAHLPVSAEAWLRVNDIDERLTMGETVQEEVKFICGIADMFTTDYKNPVEAMIIGLYKVAYSLKRPIYQINVDEFGLEMVLKKCSGKWRLSVKSEIPLDFEYYDLFNPSFKVYWYNQEEFPEDKTYNSYEEDHSMFVIELPTKYMLYMYIYLLKSFLNKRSV